MEENFANLSVWFNTEEGNEAYLFIHKHARNFYGKKVMIFLDLYGFIIYIFDIVLTEEMFIKIFKLFTEFRDDKFKITHYEEDRGYLKANIKFPDSFYEKLGKDIEYYQPIIVFAEINSRGVVKYMAPEKPVFSVYHCAVFHTSLIRKN